MSAWDIDGEESQGVGGCAGRVGAEFYTIVVHYQGAELKQTVPHHVKIDEKTGEPMKSVYKKTENQTAEGTPESVRTDKVEKWATKKDVLDNMTSECRQACNAFKTFLLKSKVLLWYHNGLQDECSQFTGVKHWHVILRSDLGANGNFKYLHDVNQFRTMKLKVKAAQGYVRVQSVRSMQGLISHFNTSPRIFLGCNAKLLYGMWKESYERPMYGIVTEFVEKAEDEEDNVNPKIEKRYSAWDDEDTPVVKKGGWEADEDAFVVPESSKIAVVVKESTTDAYCRLLKVLMLRYRANSISEMYAAIGKIPPGIDDNYKALWYRLAGKPAMNKHMENVLNYLMCENSLKSFQKLVEEFCTSPDTLNPQEYETPEDSYKIWVKWCKKQHIDVAEIVTNIINVMNKSQPKVNTICIIGPSNAGKSVMITNPLRVIMRYVGQIGNRGSDSQFVYQDCINRSLISVDECIFDPANYEDMKLMMGGETMKVAVKYQGHATLQRTPVVMTGNEDPWVLNYAAKDAMMNRMYYYRVLSDEELKDCKLMHPGMWWYLCQQYDQQNVKLKTLSKLVPYPSITPEVIDQSDPLD